MYQIDEILSKVFKGNQEYVSSHDKNYFDSFKNSQNPRIALLTCSDSRVQTSIFGIDSINEIFVVRNIGNQIMPVFGSIDYAVIHLKVRLLLIMGHTHCGAIKAVFSNYENETFDIIRELDHLSIPIRHIKHRRHDFEEEWLRITEQNIDYQVKSAIKKYHSLIDKGELTVLGIVNDFTNSFESGEGKLIIINVNGETDSEINKANLLFRNFEPDFREKTFKRALIHKNEHKV
jgi:carbonic anhydrase